MIWTFHESGIIPGLAAGPFANCRVDVHDDGTYTVLPLALPPHDAPADEAQPGPEEAATPEE